MRQQKSEAQLKEDQQYRAETPKEGAIFLGREGAAMVRCGWSAPSEVRVRVQLLEEFMWWFLWGTQKASAVISCTFEISVPTAPLLFFFLKKKKPDICQKLEK